MCVCEFRTYAAVSQMGVRFVYTVIMHNAIEFVSHSSDRYFVNLISALATATHTTGATTRPTPPRMPKKMKSRRAHKSIAMRRMLRRGNCTTACVMRHTHTQTNLPDKDDTSLNCCWQNDSWQRRQTK